MPIIKIDDTCPEKLPVSQNFVHIMEHQCMLEKGHPGLHRSLHGAVWATHDRVQSIIESEGRSL